VSTPKSGPGEDAAPPDGKEDAGATPASPPAAGETLDGLVVLAAVQNWHVQQALDGAFNSIGGLEITFSEPGAAPATALSGSNTAPDAFFFEASDEQEATETLTLLRSRPNGFSRHLVAVLPAPSQAETLRLVKAGADDVLSASPSNLDVTRTLVRARALRPRLTEFGGGGFGGGRVSVFIHASGGAGATTMAINSAVLLQQETKRDERGVCLLDLDLQFGAAHLHLDLEQQSNLMDIINTPARLDARMLEGMMIEAVSGLRVLTAPIASVPLDALTPFLADAIITLACQRYRHVIIDMPLALSHWTGAVLRRADHVFLVTQVNVTALRSAKRLIDTLKDDRATICDITVIANRFGDSAKSSRLSLSQASKALNRPVEVVVPSDYPLVIESLDQGVPAVRLRPGSRFARAMTEALNAIIGTEFNQKAPGVLATLYGFGKR
jgi:Flp pilus assembly CpaE family ATPase